MSNTKEPKMMDISFTCAKEGDSNLLDALFYYNKNKSESEKAFIEIFSKYVKNDVKEISYETSEEVADFCFFKGKNGGEIKSFQYFSVDFESDMDGHLIGSHYGYKGLHIYLPEEDAKALKKDLETVFNKYNIGISNYKESFPFEKVSLYEKEKEKYLNSYTDMNKPLIGFFKGSVDTFFNGRKEFYESEKINIFVHPNVVKNQIDENGNKFYTISGKNQNNENCSITFPADAFNIKTDVVKNSKKFNDWLVLKIQTQNMCNMDKEFFFDAKVNGKPVEMSAKEIKQFVYTLNKAYTKEVKRSSDFER